MILLQMGMRVAVIASLHATAVALPPTPLLNAHAHNDYHHRLPLHDALAEGFTSVEADIFLRGGELLVGHEVKELRPNRTLQSLYLNPLREIVEREGGTVWPVERPFLLFIDIKDDPVLTSNRLAEVLSGYSRLLTPIDSKPQAAVRIVVSGSPPRRGIVFGGKRLAGADGRIAQLGSGLTSVEMPVVSDRWGHHFTWMGSGEMPEAEREKLLRLVEQTHSEEKLLRFWATPEDESVWRVLLDSGVDLINTDQLVRLRRFLRSRSSSMSAVKPSRKR